MAVKKVNKLSEFDALRKLDQLNDNIGELLEEFKDDVAEELKACGLTEEDQLFQKAMKLADKVDFYIKDADFDVKIEKLFNAPRRKTPPPALLSGNKRQFGIRAAGVLTEPTQTAVSRKG